MQCLWPRKASQRPGVLWRTWKAEEIPGDFSHFSVCEVTRLSHFIDDFVKCSLLCTRIKILQMLVLINGSLKKKKACHLVIKYKWVNFLCQVRVPLHFSHCKTKRWPGQCHSGFSANCKMWTDFLLFLTVHVYINFQSFKPKIFIHNLVSVLPLVFKMYNYINKNYCFFNITWHFFCSFFI